jgi:hypothetical protein
MKRIASTIVAIGFALPAAASAQTERFEIGAQVATVHSSEFGANDVGVGGRLAWRLSPFVGVEGELSSYPGEFPNGRGFSSGRLEGLFGVTVGPSLGRVRPFASVRPGFAQFRAASEPLACIAIFPPPLSCQLAAGRTLFAVEAGGGVDVPATARTFVRVSIGDRLVRYPGPAFTGGEVRDGGSFSHDFRFSAGAGWRF